MSDHAKLRRPSDDGEVVSLGLASLPLVILLFQSGGALSLLAGAQLIVLAVALRLIHVGKRIHYAYAISEEAPRPFIPHKLVGSGLIGVAAWLMAAEHFSTLGPTLLIGLAATLLSVVAFGPDPLHAKISSDPQRHAAKAGQSYIKDASISIEHEVARLASLHDPQLDSLVDRARDVLDAALGRIEASPSQLDRLKKPIDKFLELLDLETTKLLATEDKPSEIDMHRFCGKLDAMCEAFERRRGTKRAQPAEFQSGLGHLFKQVDGRSAA